MVITVPFCFHDFTRSLQFSISGFRTHSPSPSYSGSFERQASADDLRERLQQNIDSYLKQHSEILEDWERALDAWKFPGLAPRPVEEFPGRRNRELALQEAKARKEAFENSKKAFKMGRKADAKAVI